MVIWNNCKKKNGQSKSIIAMNGVGSLTHYIIQILSTITQCSATFDNDKI